MAVVRAEGVVAEGRRRDVDHRRVVGGQAAAQLDHLLHLRLEGEVRGVAQPGELRLRPRVEVEVGRVRPRQRKRRHVAPLGADERLDLAGERHAVLADHLVERERLPAVRVGDGREVDVGDLHDQRLIHRVVARVGVVAVLVRAVGLAGGDHGRCDPIAEGGRARARRVGERLVETEGVQAGVEAHLRRAGVEREIGRVAFREDAVGGEADRDRAVALDVGRGGALVRQVGPGGGVVRGPGIVHGHGDVKEVACVDGRPGVVAADGRQHLLVPLPGHRLGGDGALTTVSRRNPDVVELVAGPADVIAAVHGVARPAGSLKADAGEEVRQCVGSALARRGGGERDALAFPAHQRLGGIPGPREPARFDPHAGLERECRRRAVPELEPLAAVELPQLGQGHEREPLRGRDLAAGRGAIGGRGLEHRGQLRTEDRVQAQRRREGVVHLLRALRAERGRLPTLAAGDRDGPPLRAAHGATAVGRQALVGGLASRELAGARVAHAARGRGNADRCDVRPRRVEREHAGDLLPRRPVGLSGRDQEDTDGGEDCRVWEAARHGMLCPFSGYQIERNDSIGLTMAPCRQRCLTRALL